MFLQILSFFAILFLLFFTRDFRKREGLFMKEFTKYLKMIPVIIYPYIYVVILAVFLVFLNVLAIGLQ